MTREQQISAALLLLGNAGCDKTYIVSEIEMAIDTIGVLAASQSTLPSKAQRLATRQLLHALRRSVVAAKRLAKLDIRWALFPIDLSAFIARCERELIRPARAPVRTAHKQKLAVKEALGLLLKYGTQRDVRISRNSRWHQLAAVLFGNTEADLFRHMRACSRKSARLETGASSR